MSNTKKRVPPRKPPAPPKLKTFRITVKITEGFAPDVSWPGGEGFTQPDAYAVPMYLRKAAQRVESELLEPMK